MAARSMQQWACIAAACAALGVGSVSAIAANAPAKPLPLAPVTPDITLPTPPSTRQVAAPVAAVKQSSEITNFTLENGLQVVVLSVPHSPVVTHMVWYRVGAKDDVAGKSGLAHFVEHMLFQGTKNQKPGEFSRVVERLGGEHNAFTSPDVTAYHVHIAARHLPEIMKREADRMQNMNPPPEAFAKEREVILEERRQQVETDPGARLREEMDAALFLHHPYRTPVIGWQAEMETLNQPDVQAFYAAHYAPNNAVLVLAGGITEATARELAQQYYGAIPKRELPAAVQWVEPTSKANQKLEYRDAQTKRPSYMMSWQVPSIGQDGVKKALPYFVLSALLGESKSSRMFQELVVRDKLATMAGSNYVGMSMGPGRFVVWAVPTDADAAAKNMATRLRLEQAVDVQLANIARYGVKGSELERTRTQLKASAIYAMDGVKGAATLLGQLVMLGLPPTYLSQWPADIDAVSAKQIQEAAADLLARRRVSGWLLPEQNTAGGQR
jgi:zinc protease